MLKINLENKPKALELPEIKTSENRSRISIPLSPVLASHVNTYATAGIQTTGDYLLDQILNDLDYRILYALTDQDQKLVFLMVVNAFNQKLAIIPDVGDWLNLDLSIPRYPLTEITTPDLLNPITSESYIVSLVVDGVLKYQNQNKTLTYAATNISDTHGNNQLRQWTVNLDNSLAIWPVILYSTLIKAPKETNKNVNIAYYRLLKNKDEHLTENIDQRLEQIQTICQQIGEYRTKIKNYIQTLHRVIYILFIVRATNNPDYRHTHRVLGDYIRQVGERLEDIDIDYISKYVEEALTVNVDRNAEGVLRVDRILKDRQDKLSKLENLLDQLNQQLNFTSVEFIPNLMQRIDQVVGDCQQLYCPN